MHGRYVGSFDRQMKPVRTNINRYILPIGRPLYISYKLGELKDQDLMKQELQVSVSTCSKDSVLSACNFATKVSNLTLLVLN